MADEQLHKLRGLYATCGMGRDRGLQDVVEFGRV